MDKNEKSKPSYNQDIIKIIQARYGYSQDYIRKSIRGDRTGIICIMIKDEYIKLHNEALKAIESQLYKL